MAPKRRITADQAKQVGTTLGLGRKKIDLEHGVPDRETNVINEDLTLTGKIAWAHLKEFPDYDTRLDKLEAEADACWALLRSRRRRSPSIS